MLRLRILTAFFCCVALTPWSAAQADERLKSWVDGELQSLVGVYQDLHRNPELSFHEKETSAKIAKELEAAGLKVTTNVGGFGVVGVLENGPGPVVLVRTDLDALPVTEATNLAYQSTVRVKDDEGNEVGVMHACGHDIHMTCLVGTARFLAANKDRFRGTIVFIGQPAEERVAGAKAMLKDGLFTRFPKPDFALALHVDSGLAAGKVSYRAGYALANSDSVDITIRGKGGHGAFPHTTVDPIVVAAHLIVDLQTIVSREISPTDPAVITVGAIHAGAKHNIISDECHLKLTVRSYKDEVRKQLLAAIERKAKAVSMSFRAEEPLVEVSEGVSAMYNDDHLVEMVAPALIKELGEARIETNEPTMGGEDFSEYGKAGVPIFMFRLGTVEQAKLDRFKKLGVSPPSLHSDSFFPEAEPCIHTGVTAMCAAVLQLTPSEASSTKAKP